MSAGHQHLGAYADAEKLRRIAESNDFDEWRYGQYREVDNSYDLPYLAGYSEDGSKIYIDRHLPEELKIGRKLIRPREFLRLHEEVEKYLIDMLDWGYSQAHSVATAAERRAVLAAGIFWDEYQKEMEKYVKHDEHEKLETVPPDLDMTPYLAPPVDRKLISRMKKAMGEKKRGKKDEEVNYSDTRGYPKRHCGPTPDWPKGYCKYYGNNDCELVEGYIDPKGGCDLYEKSE
jgi:hypothetical protein